MNKIIPLFFFLHFLTSVAFAQKPSFCNLAELEKSPISIFTNQKNKTKWISASQESDELFFALGFSPEKVKSLRGQKIENLKQCSFSPKFFKSFATGNMGIQISAINSCQEIMAKQLGLQAAEDFDNYGSMESGSGYNMVLLNICTNGKEIFNCPVQTPEMAKCLSALTSRK